MLKNFIAGLAFVAGLTAADSALALGGNGKTSASFNVSIAGVRAGRMDISSNVSGKSYGVDVHLRSTGLVAAVATYKFKSSSRGTRTGDRYSPTRYKENSDTGKRKNNITITYSGGVPKPSVTSPAPALGGSGQKGTVDPGTAAFATYRDRTKAELCNTRLVIYDGKRRTRLTMRPGKITSTSATCNGTFERLGGFTKKKMAEGTRFPMTVTYKASGGVYKVQSVVVKSERGRATFTRR